MNFSDFNLNSLTGILNSSAVSNLTSKGSKKSAAVAAPAPVINVAAPASSSKMMIGIAAGVIALVAVLFLSMKKR